MIGGLPEPPFGRVREGRLRHTVTILRAKTFSRPALPALFSVKKGPAAPTAVKAFILR